MSSYTITIAADDPGQATTTLTVALDGTTARITELVVRAGVGDGLTASQIPAVDLDLLLRAVTPVTDGQQVISPSPAAAAEAAPAADNASLSPQERVADTEAAEPTTTDTSTPDKPAAASPAEPDVTEVAVPKQASRAKPRAAGTAQRGGRKKAAGTTSTSSARKATRKTATNDTSTAKGRVYRRSPSDLETVYQQAGSASAIADHYDVPQHTAQGWIRTLRRRQASPAE